MKNLKLYWTLLRLVPFIVNAAEKIFGAGAGKEKLAYALGELRQVLGMLDIPDLTEAALTSIIDATVQLLNALGVFEHVKK